MLGSLPPGGFWVFLYFYSTHSVCENIREYLKILDVREVWESSLYYQHIMWIFGKIISVKTRNCFGQNPQLLRSKPAVASVKTRTTIVSAIPQRMEAVIVRAGVNWF